MRDQERHPDPGVELLIRAGIVLATSLHDPTTTMREVAGLTVPDLGDMCVIDLLDDSGAIRDVGVAAADPELERGLEDLRRRFPLSHEGEHPVAQVIRSGQPILLSHMDDEDLASYAESSPHARFMIDHDYRSAVVAPLVARDRTLGAISVLRLGERQPYDRDDLDLVRALAWRAALAIDNARLFSEVRGLEQRLEAILANVAEAITVSDAEGKTIFANQAAAELLSVEVPEQLTSSAAGSIMSRFYVADEHGRELDWEDMPSRALFRGEQPQPLLVRNVIRATGEERWLMVRCSPLHDPETGEAVYSVNVFENVTDIKRAQLAGHFLAEASRVLGSSLDYGLTLQRIAQLAVPQIADWCAVDLVGERGEVERVAAHGSDPGRLLPGEGATIEMPMAIATREIGTITLAMADSGRRFGEDDIELAEELGRRAGVAVENARLYTERSRIASTLQRALLPESLPTIPGVELDALYTAAGELNEVGGDFYDVFACGEDRWMLLIGDVCGKGPRAAAVTALARYTLRAAAMSGKSPPEMLRMLHEALLQQQGPSDMCTACLVLLEPSDRGAALQIALGGHPPPLLVRADGEIEQAGRIGTLLGMIDPIVVDPVETTLAPGDTLLLYTDGVTDAGSDGTTIGEQGLLDLCAAAEGDALGRLLRHIEDAALELSQGSLRDDLALLAVRAAPREAPLASSTPDADADAQLQPAS